MSGVPSASAPIVDVMEYSPSRRSAMRPETRGGTRTRCLKSPCSITTPSSSPGRTSSPTRAVAVKFQTRSASSVGMAVPAAMQSPHAAATRSSGRPTPSRSMPSNPGPSSAQSGAPVVTTGSPTRSPVVSSKTCSVAVSPCTRMISARRRCSPTYATSYTVAAGSGRASTSDPATRTTAALIAV
jgi:hypothetical protein